MSDTILSFIDSTVPEIWLPQAACDQFETHFGLQYDPQTDRYLVNETIHSQLSTLNPTITFRLAIDALGATFQDIVLPYAAFDLQASYPIYKNPTNYFPIRRAANESQYTIGRTFLQEAYVVADYDRQQFSVNQASFPASGTLSPQQLVAIYPPGAKSSTGLSGGAIAGIVVGAVAGVALIVGLMYYFFRRRRRSSKSDSKSDPFPPEKSHHPVSVGEPDNRAPPEYASKAGRSPELMSDPRHEMPSPDALIEADGTLKRPDAHEMSGQSSPRGTVPELYSGMNSRPELEAGNKIGRGVNPSDYFYELPGDGVSRFGGSARRGSPGFGSSPGGSPHLSPRAGSQSSGTGRSPSPLGMGVRR